MVLLSGQFQITPNYSVHTSAGVPAKNILTITSPLSNLSGNFLTQCSEHLFLGERFQLKKRKLQIHTTGHGSKVLHLSPTLGPTLTLRERTKIFVPPTRLVHIDTEMVTMTVTKCP